MAKRQNQIKQVWFNDEDEENFRIIAESLKEKGEDVEPDNRRAKEDYSHTKVIRLLLNEAALRLKADDEDGELTPDERAALGDALLPDGSVDTVRLKATGRTVDINALHRKVRGD